MSEVYIRSQNHEKIYTLNGSYAIKYKEFSVSKEHRIFICLSAESMYTLGVYESKERCIEVLDEIQAVCRSYLKVEGSAALMRGGMDVQPAAFTVPRFYQMPEK